MDKSLNFYINYANEMQNLFVKNGINTSITKLKTNINEMNIHIKNIQAITKKLIDVSNIANELVLQKKKNINLDKMDKLDNSSELKPISKLFKQINPIKSNEKDFITLINKYENTKINIIDKYNSKIPVKIVDNINDIPINYIYYIKNIKQFGYNINGLNITGNIGEIDTNKTNLTICKYGVDCKNIIKGKKCNYYHQPNDFIFLYNNKIIDENIKEYLLENNIFNFTNGGWIYNGNILNNKTKHMRHIGGKNTIKYDLEIIKNNIDLFQDEIEKRKAQSIHDIIILSYLLNNNCMTEYLSWSE